MKPINLNLVEDKNSVRVAKFPARSENVFTGLPKAQKKRRFGLFRKKTQNPYKKKSKLKKFLKYFCIFLFIAIIVSGALVYKFAYISAKNIQNSVEKIKAASTEIGKDFEDKNIANLDSNIAIIQNELNYIDSELSQYEFLKELSYTKGYYDNLQIIRNVVARTDVLVADSVPQLKDVLELTGFEVEAPNTQNTTLATTDLENVKGDESAFNLILAEMPLYLELYKGIEPQIIGIFDEINQLNPDYLPNVGGIDVKDRLKSFNKFSKDFPERADQLTSFLQYLPELIGSGGDTDYLLILQNEAEMRASGGLLTAYGHLKIENGEFEDEITLSDMWNLENYVSSSLGVDVGYRNIYGQNVLMNQGCGSTYLRAQDAGIYPDLYWTMNTFTDYYDVANLYYKEEYPDYDHVIILNHQFAENLLSLIQPLEVEGYGEVTAEGLFEFIKAETDKPELSYSPERKGIIKEIANAAKEKFQDLEVDRVKDVVSIIVDSFNAKDIALYSPNEEIQSYFDLYGMSGRTEKNFEGDYFHLNEAQNCSLKLNNYVRNTVEQNISINDDGSIGKSVNINWTQPQIYDESLRLQYSPTFNFTYRAWVRIFAPMGVETFDSNGYQSSGYLYYYPQEYDDEIENKSISDNIIQFDHRRFTENDPIPGRDLNVSYNLPANINYNVDGNYKLLIQKHPGKSWGEEYTININHNSKNYSVNLTLDRDKVITYKDGIITVDNYRTDLDWLSKLVNGSTVE